jgi:phosphoribosyl 1,2-cyclic phosphodiesterase
MNRVRFWGTRGSIPVALTADGVCRKLALRGASGRTFASDAEAGRTSTRSPRGPRHVGGHSPCVEIETGGPDFVICDLGSGVRPFGQAALARDGGGPRTYHVFLSHVHWDHIMGLPFFTPAYIPGNRVVIYGGHAHLEAALRRQQEQPSFPVDFSTFRADILRASSRASSTRSRHAGEAAAAPRGRLVRLPLRVGRQPSFSTDSEHDLGNCRETDAFVEFSAAPTS